LTIPETTFVDYPWIYDATKFVCSKSIDNLTSQNFKKPRPFFNFATPR
jgi:hypothetical protein